MWQAFVTGFAEKATSLIEERNKEIRDEIFMQMNQRAKENEKIKEKAQLRIERAKEIARDLEGILGNRFGDQTKSMVRELMLSGDPETIIKQVREGNIGVDDIGNFVKLDPTAPKGTPEDLYAAMAPRAKAAAPRSPEQETTAFGLPTRIGEQTRKSFMARTGMTEAEAAGLELPELPKPTATFNYDVFRGERKPKNVTDLEARMADNAVAEGMTIDEYRTTNRGKILQAQIDGRNLLAAERKGTEEEKDRAASAIRSNISNRLRERFQPLEFNKILQWETDAQGNGRYRVLLPNHPDAKKFEKERLDEIKKYYLASGIVDKEGNIRGGRNAADALYDHAEVDFKNMRVTSWRSSPLGEPSTKDKGAAPAPARQGAAEPAVPKATMDVPPAAAAPKAATPAQGDRQASIENAKTAAEKIRSSATLSVGEKNGKLSIIRDRLRKAGIDPKEAGL